jgi:hypothetical protein
MAIYTNPRFQAAHEKALADWAAADPAARATVAGCEPTEAGVLVPFFGRPYLVTHPAGEVALTPPFAEPGALCESAAGKPGAGTPVHVSVVILLLHYLLRADGAPADERWLAFRELPEGMFYAQAFAAHAETTLGALVRDENETTTARLEGLRRLSEELGGRPLELGDLSYRFQALPRLAVAVVLWRGDDEEPGEARILFDANAHHSLPTEDLAGMGDWLAHTLTRG